ncbi:PAN domain-containing [Fusarium albosuccineum]|uniref:PAN domain-containing n=1 Tax=Fusarium albosuccineum TaxID=1237068 RepID=A0A8H4L7X1_9HYPO|nr:PAN domain-containing [Fusarium albosuccineum]
MAAGIFLTCLLFARVSATAGVCNRDNLFRCFIDQRYSVQASGFCSGLSPFTATVATTTATMSEHTITLLFEAQVTVDAIIDTITSTTTEFTETIPTSTTVVTQGADNVVKRDAAASPAPPKCMTNGVTYPASRITSACSCIDVPAVTVSVTQTVSIETVTRTTTAYTTPLATITAWETIYTATSSGVLTATVAPPSVNRLINGDFETGTLEGWQLVPDSWKGQMSNWNVAPVGQGNWSLQVLGSADNSLGSLLQIKPIYLESGKYRVKTRSTPFKFPMNTDAWRNTVVFEAVNLDRGTNITVKYGGGKVQVIGRAIAVPFQQDFDIPKEAAGYTQVSIRYTAPNPPFASIDGISLERLA